MFTFIIGFIANILVITGDILFPDSYLLTEFYISNIWDLSLGRWFLRFIDYTRFGLSSPLVSTTFALLALSFSSILISDLFKIKNKVNKYIISLLLVVSPFFTETLFSVFCSFEFTVSFLLSILSVYFLYKIDNKVFRIILSAICLTLSLGLYQAYLGVTCGLCLLVPIVLLLKKEINTKELIQKIIESLIMGIISILLYEGILHILLALSHVSMADYSGANEIGLKTILNIPTLLKDAYTSFANYYLNNEIINNLIYRRNYLNIIILVISILLIIKLVKNNFRKNKSLVIFEIIIMFLLLPLALGIIELIASERDINQLMAAPYVLIYIFIISLFDNLNLKLNIDKILYGVSTLLVLVIIDSYFVMSAASSMAAKITKENTLFAARNMINEIYQTDGYNPNTKVLFVGSSKGDYFKRSNPVYRLSSGLTPNISLMWDEPNLTNRGWNYIIEHNLGIKLTESTMEDYNKIINTFEFKEMNTYPKKEYTKIIDDVLVVKVSE